MRNLRILLRGIKRSLKHRKRRAQAAIESAIVIPLMTFMILGTLQLAMIQHARIMTEYAAFNAARAGIVWNADPWIMENAAIISLLPTYEGLIGEADIGNPGQMIERIVKRALLYQINRRLPQAADMVRRGTDALIAQLPSVLAGGASGIRDAALGAATAWADNALQNAVNNLIGGDDLRMVQVEILNPRLGDLALSSPEIDFDAVRSGSSWRRRTRLTIRVRYLYMLRIPFANWIIHQAWRAHRAGQELYGAIHNPGSQSSDTLFNKGGDTPEIRGRTDLDQVLAGMAKEGVYLIPLRAEYTMRMQSNPYRVSLMANVTSGP